MCPFTRQAAYHLQIKPLVDLTCQAIAQLLKGKTPAEIRRTFNILYDFQPEDDGTFFIWLADSAMLRVRASPASSPFQLLRQPCGTSSGTSCAIPSERSRSPKLFHLRPNPLVPIPSRGDRCLCAQERDCQRQSFHRFLFLVSPLPIEDTRSVDDLVSFINDGKGNTGASSIAKTKSKGSKKARQRERKKKVCATGHVAVAEQVFTPLFLFSFQSRSSQERERDSLRTSQEKLNYGPRTSQELARGGLRSSQEKGRTRGNQQEDRTTREKRERREDIIQKIINMQRVNEESEGDIIRSNSTSPSPSFSSTSSSPVSSSPSSSSSSPLSSPLSSPSHSRNPSGNSSDLFYHSNDDNGVLYGSKAARRDNGLKLKQGTRAPKHTIVSDKGLMLTWTHLDRLGQKPLTCRQINPISYGPLVRHATPWAARCQRRPRCLAIRTGTRWRSRWTMTYGRFVAWFVPFPPFGLVLTLPNSRRKRTTTWTRS